MHHLAPHNCWELLRSHGFNLANQWVAATKRSGKALSEPLKNFWFLWVASVRNNFSETSWFQN
jgi:hypothetical protein